MKKIYIGLGSNLSKPEQQIRDAVKEITQVKGLTLTQVSALYYSRPMGPQDQPNYMNAVCEVETQLLPLDLLDQLQKIENLAGRVRKENRWGARVLDLDILLYANETIAHERLTIPHYGLKLREFVLIPLAEINANLHLPDGESIKILSQKIPKNDLKIYDHSLVQYLA